MTHRPGIGPRPVEMIKESRKIEDNTRSSAEVCQSKTARLGTKPETMYFSKSLRLREFFDLGKEESKVKDLLACSKFSRK